MNVLCFGQQNWNHCWTGKQQLMTRLARRGHRVLYVDPDWSSPEPSHADEPSARLGRGSEVRASELREVGPGSLFVHTHAFQPWLGWRLNGRAHVAALRRVSRRLHLGDAAALVLRPDHPERIDAVRPAARVYYAVDEWSAFPGYSDEERRRLRRAEEVRLRESALALAVSPKLLTRFLAFQPESVLLPNGADVEHFSPGRLARAQVDPAVAAIPGPRIGFVGQTDDRLDTRLIAALSAARPDWSFVFVGRRPREADLSAIEDLPNVHLLGYRPYEELPGILAGFDVCTIPYEQNELTHSCSPLKAYEYVATGKPVVATPLEGLAPLAGTVELAAGPRAWLAALERALADPVAGRSERLRVAHAASWETRTDELEEHLSRVLRAALRSAPPRALRASALASLPDPPERLHEYGRSFDDRPSFLARSGVRALDAFGRILHTARRGARLLRGRPARIASILVVRNAWLGDTLALLPALRALRAFFPRAEIVLGVQPGMATHVLLEDSLGIEVRELDFLQAEGRMAQLRGLLAFHRHGFDAVISGEEYFMRREAFFLGAPYRVGLCDGHPLHRWNGRTLLLDRARHAADAAVALVQLLAGRPLEESPSPLLELDPRALAEHDERIARRFALEPSQEIVVLHPGAAKETRRWEPERFGRLADELLARRGETRLVVTGVAGESELFERIRACVAPERRDRLTDAIAGTELFELCALLRRAALLIGNDTGSMHLARALGTPLLALFGPENDRRWGPHPHGGAAPAVVVRHVVPCAPCGRARCPELFCLRSLRVETVLAQSLALLDGGTEDHSVRTHRVHETWESLQEAGFELPRLTVVCEQEGGAEALAALARQDYPAIEPALARDSERAENGHRNGAATRRASRLPEPFELAGRGVAVRWEELLRGTTGEFVTFFNGDPWSSERAGAHVASLLRCPDADYAFTSGREPVSAPAPADVTLRRDALEARLARAGRSATGLVWSELLAGMRGTSSDCQGPRGTSAPERSGPAPLSVNGGGR